MTEDAFANGVCGRCRQVIQKIPCESTREYLVIYACECAGLVTTDGGRADPRFRSWNNYNVNTITTDATGGLMESGRGGCFPESPLSQVAEKSEFLPEGF